MLAIAQAYVLISVIFAYSISLMKSFSLEIPPPCNEHYLMTCSKGVSNNSSYTKGVDKFHEHGLLGWMQVFTRVAPHSGATRYARPQRQESAL